MNSLAASRWRTEGLSSVSQHVSEAEQSLDCIWWFKKVQMVQNSWTWTWKTIAEGPR